MFKICQLSVMSEGHSKVYSDEVQKFAEENDWTQISTEDQKLLPKPEKHSYWTKSITNQPTDKTLMTQYLQPLET